MLAMKISDGSLETISGLLVMIVTLAGGWMTEVTNTPTLLIDDEHSQIGFSNSVPPLVYNLVPTRRLILDTRHYAFRRSKKFGVGEPNCVQVTLDESQRYVADLKPTVRKQLLDVSSLRPLGQSPPFSGFRPGDTVTIAIGHSSTNNGVQDFSPCWIGLAKVDDVLNLPPLANAGVRRSEIHPDTFLAGRGDLSDSSENSL